VFKFIMGMVVGFMVSNYYPSISPVAKEMFLESGGARDSLVNTLKEIK